MLKLFFNKILISVTHNAQLAHIKLKQEKMIDSLAPVVDFLNYLTFTNLLAQWIQLQSSEVQMSWGYVIKADEQGISQIGYSQTHTHKKQRRLVAINQYNVLLETSGVKREAQVVLYDNQQQKKCFSVQIDKKSQSFSSFQIIIVQKLKYVFKKAKRNTFFQFQQFQTPNSLFQQQLRNSYKTIGLLKNRFRNQCFKQFSLRWLFYLIGKDEFLYFMSKIQFLIRILKASNIRIALCFEHIDQANIFKLLLCCLNRDACCDILFQSFFIAWVFFNFN